MPSQEWVPAKPVSISCHVAGSEAFRSWPIATATGQPSHALMYASANVKVGGSEVVR